jgi:hypothetical protein
VRQLSSSVQQSQLPGQSHLWNSHRDQLAARDLVDGASPGQQRDTHLLFHGALDALEARQRNLNIDGCVPELGLS